MTLRDRTEAALRSWNHHEIGRGAPPVVDYDCHPQGATDVQPATSRLHVRRELEGLGAEAADRNADVSVSERVGAALAYLDALLGAREPLDDYVRATQGCAAAGWSDEHLERVRIVAVTELDRLDIGWDSATSESLATAEGLIDAADAADVIRRHASDLEGSVRSLVDSDAPFNVRVEHVDLAVYWAYWLDGSGADVRLRINARNASFTDVQARQFALHELLGHGLQCASYSAECRERDVPWVRMTSVHAQQQVLLEGLAQALPLFVLPDDQALTVRVRLAHYLELVRAKVHIALNDGVSIPECVAMARSHVPFWSEARIGDMLTDRGADPLLRSYLWSYPAGIDWFVSLADLATPEMAENVIRTSYRAPLTPDGLSTLWPDGPAIGGAGQLVVAHP
ncbi:MAG: hypothetical protein LH603_07450 [Pseudonocardia sp.]|nr:hypothetical protein [Pseudonocardia sp.]